MSKEGQYDTFFRKFVIYTLYESKSQCVWHIATNLHISKSLVYAFSFVYKSENNDEKSNVFSPVCPFICPSENLHTLYKETQCRSPSILDLGSSNASWYAQRQNGWSVIWWMIVGCSESPHSVVKRANTDATVRYSIKFIQRNPTMILLNNFVFFSNYDCLTVCELIYSV